MRFLVPLLVVLVGGRAAAQDVPLQSSDAPPQSADPSGTIDRGLAFLAKDALAWKAEHNCHSCHHAALVVWAFREAKLRGHAVDEPVLANMTQWLTTAGEGKVGLPRPEGRPKAFNSKALYYSLALSADPAAEPATRQALTTLLATVQSDQTDDGSWQTWPDTRPPIFGSSDETLTAMATLALLPAAQAGDTAAESARDRGQAWLARTPTDDDPQSVALRLVLWQRLGRPPEELAPLSQRIQARQNADGGWSQSAEMASDAWATGQALYALAHAGLTPAEPAIARGHAFLAQTQREDGSWPMTSRPTQPTKPDGAGATNLMPITGGGSAWAVLGLVRSG